MVISESKPVEPSAIFIRANLNQVKVEGLVDTGSDHNYIREEL